MGCDQTVELQSRRNQCWEEICADCGGPLHLPLEHCGKDHLEAFLADGREEDQGAVLKEAVRDAVRGK